MALSLVANVVLLALLVFKTAPQPAVRRCGDFSDGGCCSRSIRLQRRRGGCRQCITLLWSTCSLISVLAVQAHHMCWWHAAFVLLARVEAHQHLLPACLSCFGREGEPCMAPLVEPLQRGQREEGTAAGLQLQSSGSSTAAATATGAAVASDSVQAAYPVVPAGQPFVFCCAPCAIDPLHTVAHSKGMQAETNPHHRLHGILVG